MAVSADKYVGIVFKKHRGTLGKSLIFKFLQKHNFIKNEMNYLGVIIDNKLSWTPHLNYIKSKVITLVMNFKNFSGFNWYFKYDLVKFWYDTVFHNIVTYCGAV